MKTNIGKTLALGIALAAGIVRADRIVVTQDRENALYAAGEEARFSVSVVDDAGQPRKDGSARWTLDNFGTEKVADGQASLAAGNPFTVTGTLAKPGFLRLKVDSGTNSAVWSVGYDVGAIRQDGTRPSDFDCYWRGEQQRLRREVPLDPTCEKVEAQSRGRWDVFKISFRTFNAKRVWGFMSVPKDRSKAPFRTRVRICDACAGAIGPWEANADEVTVTMNVFDYEPATTNEEQKRRHAEKNAELKAKYGTGRYSVSGIGDSREDYYFHDAMLGIDRAIDWLAECPEVDRTRMYYFGSSQGGGFGLYVTYLNGNFSKVCFAVPACTGHYGHLQGRQDGWPGLIAAQPEAKRKAAEKFAAYFDGVHFAAGIHRPVRFLVGFADQTCPPPDVYAAFNACVSKDKAIVNCVGSGHCGFNDWVRTNEGKPSWLDYNAWLRDETKRLKVLMVGDGFPQGFLRDLPSVAKACGVEVDPVSTCIDEETGTNFVDVLKAERWDVVVVRQRSGDSRKPKPYHPHFADLYKRIKTNAAQAEVVVQETPGDDASQYRDLHRASYDAAAAHGLRVIPVGTAVRLWSVRRPDASREGDCADYLQALVWTAKLFGVDVTECPFVPDGLEPEKAALLRRTAAEAVRGVRVPVSDGGFDVPDGIAAKIEKLRAAGVNRGEIVELDYDPAYGCLRVAYVLRHSPVSYVRCELALPDPAKWDGRLWGYGNGGWAGGVSTPGRSSASAQVSTDLGTSRLTIGTNPCDIEILRDFGWRATHEMTVEAKKLIALYYGRGPDHSYFTGASTGGGQGFCEMQRYPGDYDGIIAAVPGNDRLARATGLWQVMQARKTARAFTEAERKTIRRAELDYFAKTDPEIARGRFIWDPTPTKENLDGCWQAIVAADPNLRDREAAWRSLFDDAVVRGRRLEPGALIGLELDPPWNFMLEKYVGPIPWGGVTEEQLLFFADEPNMRHVNDDLSAFAKRGGKLIAFGGLEDMSVPERPIAEYFDAVARRVGGVEKAQDFFLYYRIPGRQHCHCAPYPHGFVGEPKNLREKIVAWVEKGERPEAIVVPFVDEPETTLTLRPYPGPARLDLAPIVQKSLVEGECVIEASLAATDAFLAFKAAHPGAPIVLDSSTVPSTPDGSSPAWNAIRAVRRFVDGKTVFWKSTADRYSYLYWTPDQGKEDKVAPVAAYPDGRLTLMENGEYYWRNRVRAQMDRVKALRGKTVDIVFLGDSQTHFMEGRWGRLESPWPSVTAFTNGLVTLNLGIGGDRTEHALWRAKNGQLDGYRAKAVSILIGSNDGGKRDSADDIVRGVSEIVKTVQAKLPDATIVLTALFPNRFTTGDPQETKRSEIRAGVRKLTDERKVLWLDVGDELRGPDGRIRKEYALDGVHLNDAGYGVWLGAMREKLD